MLLNDSFATDPELTIYRSSDSGTLMDSRGMVGMIRWVPSVIQP